MATSGTERPCVRHGPKTIGRWRAAACVPPEADDRPGVEDVHRRAVASEERVFVAAVYRTVRPPEEAGISRRRDSGGGRARHEAAECGHPPSDAETGEVVESNDAEHGCSARAFVGRPGFEAVSIRPEAFGWRPRAGVAAVPGRDGADGGAG